MKRTFLVTRDRLRYTKTVTEQVNAYNKAYVNRIKQDLFCSLVNKYLDNKETMTCQN